ncbi:unnamed protein product [Microthlaspi erraticum]|uniref:Reverse transcriptase zinc-binding domain-containing protein n=1 Tax=Microthlaspi erraticum TaxID=1685480 RepID=A0A6D2JDZ7_9BRAS|nr:unnamed protein product [Microthlaspi erraticum]
MEVVRALVQEFFCRRRQSLNRGDQTLGTERRGYLHLGLLQDRELYSQICILGSNADKTKRQRSDASPKVQHFLWKCISNSLPVAGNLLSRHIAKEGSCVRCPNNKVGGSKMGYHLNDQIGLQRDNL